ncbi:hypothetical protein BXZ70DRAFT_1005121 [Cristinia sonorae]|uniref:Uncharacterized protein n=1 Tax=Cristinia sonorae TaxID=1940300 RepID=A0A8K0UUL3_9AGAR|nr:hypothetical protein BXZ70DRAFT_1005121 [Cristinia sonorae]
MSSQTTSEVVTSSTSSSPSSPPAFTPPSNGPGNTTPLYLFAFLATLLILLSVSSTIVLRSFYLRRQMRIRYHAAIAAGVIPPPTTRKKDFGPKPVLYDAAIMPALGEKWEHFKPVSARVVNLPSRNRQAQSQAGRPAPIARLRESVSRSWRHIQGLPPRPPRPLSPVSTEPVLKDPLADASRVQVSVLVAMPHPHAGDSKGKGRAESPYWDDEEGIPDVVFGVSQVALKRGEQQPE